MGKTAIDLGKTIKSGREFVRADLVVGSNPAAPADMRNGRFLLLVYDD